MPNNKSGAQKASNANKASSGPAGVSEKKTNQKEQANVPQKQQQGNQAQGQAQRRPPVNDPAEEVFRKRIDEIEAKIQACRDELNKIRISLDEKNKLRENVFEEQNKIKSELNSIGNHMKEAIAEKQKILDQLKEVRRLRKLKWEEANKIKAKLSFVPADDDDGFAQKIEEQIKKLEIRLSSQSVPLAEEKKLVAEIDKLQQTKKHFKEYMTVRANIKQDDATVRDLDAQLEKMNTQLNGYKSQKDSLRSILDESSSKISSSRADIPDVLKRREDVRQEIKQYQDQIDQEWTKIKELRKKKRDEENERIRQLREKDKERRKEIYEKRKQADLERQKLELQKIPYQEEMDLCDHLIAYLQSLVPATKAEDDDAASNGSAPVPEGFTALKREDDSLPASARRKDKAKNKKKPAVKASQDLKHVVDVFLYFEQLSLIPPSRVADVDNSIAEVRAKKEHYQKLSTATIQDRQANGEAKQAEAEKSAVTTTENEPSPPVDVPNHEEVPKDDGILVAE
jgi:uncharacterized coiled-coil DUF342 family protein